LTNISGIRADVAAMMRLLILDGNGNSTRKQRE
jgi:hypothetical protein